MDSISQEYGVVQAAIGSAQSEPVIAVRGLVKRYSGHEAVAGIDLEVRRGEIFALLGPNGAGKTTTVEILEGFQPRTEGQVSVLGYDPATAGGAWRDRVGVVLQESQPEPGLSVRQLGKSVFLTTHYMDEAEYLADQITVLPAGHVVAEGTPQTLAERDHMTTTISFTLPGHVQARDLPPGLRPLTEPGPGRSTVLHSQSPLAHLQMLGNWAPGRGFDLPDLDVRRPTLEQVYLSLTEPASTKDQR
jgi:ABC-type multidrug transport system ATPase subunit